MDIDVRTLDSTRTLITAMSIAGTVELDVESLGNNDVAYHRAKIDEWLDQWGLKIDPDNVLHGGSVTVYLNDAEATGGLDRIDLILKAYRKAQSFYYGRWANGQIRGKSMPLPEDIKTITSPKPAPVAVDEVYEKIKAAAAVLNEEPAKPAGKLALYEDKALQAEKEAKWPWIIPGSWQKDPEKDNGAIVTIRCQVCNGERVIHAADAFQVKRCVACKGK